MCLLCKEALKLSKIREATNSKSEKVVYLVFEGFDLMELSISYFKNAKDFRDFPNIVEELITNGGGWIDKWNQKLMTLKVKNQS